MTIISALARAAAAATVLSTLALAAPAQAETGSYADPADATGSLHDLREVKVVHGARQLFARVTVADLRASSDAGPAGLTLFVDTDPDRSGPEIAVTTGLQEGSDYQLVRTRGWRLVGDPLTCAHRVRLLPDEDVVKVRVARSCLGEPDAVRVAVRMVDQYDGSHPMTDWLKGPRRFTPWLASA